MLDYYRKNGLNFFRYIYYKNYALRNFAADMTKLIIDKDPRIRNYFNLKEHFFKNLIFPMAYFSLIYYACMKMVYIYRRVKNGI